MNKKTNFLTSPISFVSTSNAGIYQQSKPFFADIDKETLNISTDELNQYLIMPKRTYKDYKSQDLLYTIGSTLMKRLGLEVGGKR